MTTILAEFIIEYLLFSSALLLIIGLLAYAAVHTLKICGKARLWVYALIFILPVVYPFKKLLPEPLLIPVYLNSWEPDHLLRNRFFSENPDQESSFFSAPFRIVEDKGEGNRTIILKNETSEQGLGKRLMGILKPLRDNGKMIGAVLWAMVAFFLIFRLITAGYKINRFYRFSEQVTDPRILKLLQQCVSDTGMRFIPRLYQVEGLSTPMVSGFFRPYIIIPTHLVKPEFREGLRFTFLHELKHIHQHHNFWLLVESVIGAAYFFHPVIHWARGIIHEELEHICDSHVIKVTHKSGLYADFLLNEIWKQNQARNPALALPFISSASKTASRINSILEDARPTLFSQIRNKAAVFVFLLVFSCIWILDIESPAYQPEQAVHVLSPVVIDSNEGKSTNHKTEEIEGEKGTPFIENISNPLFQEESDPANNADIAPKPATGAEYQDEIIDDKKNIEPVAKVITPVIALSDKALKSETTQEHKAMDPIQPVENSASDNDPEKSELIKQSDFHIKIVQDKPASSKTKAEKYLGAPVSALTIHRIKDINILDQSTIVFMMSGGDLYLTRLSDPCPSLLMASDFNILSNTGRISKYDRIQALSFGRILGTTGILGPIYPYIYQGDKWKAVKQLKNTLLKGLVDEGAFEES